MANLLNRDDYAKLSPETLRSRIKSAKSRIDRITDIDVMVGEMFAVQEMEAALSSKSEAA